MRACEEKKARRSPKSNLESSRAKNKKNERITSTLARLKSTQQEKVSVRLDQASSLITIKLSVPLKGVAKLYLLSLNLNILKHTAHRNSLDAPNLAEHGSSSSGKRDTK